MAEPLVDLFKDIANSIRFKEGTYDFNDLTSAIQVTIKKNIILQNHQDRKNSPLQMHQV